jgi:hypothetical protein
MKKRKKTSSYWILNFERGESVNDAGLASLINSLSAGVRSFERRANQSFASSSKDPRNRKPSSRPPSLLPALNIGGKTLTPD